jgi:hypothetical protein
MYYYTHIEWKRVLFIRNREQIHDLAVYSGRAVQGMKWLRPLEYWDRGFESNSRHGCLSACILCSCRPVQVAALRRADPPSKEAYRLSTRLRN